MNDPLGLFGDEQSNDPLGLFDQEKPKAGFGVAFKKALASAGNAMESAISLPAGALASYAGFQEQGDEIFRQMEANRAARTKWANPDNLETSLGQDIGAMALTLPAQIPAMLGAAGEKGMDLIQRGEPLSTAIPTTLVDAGLNAAGMGPMQAAKSVAGRAVIGAAGNVAFGAGSDAATQLLAQQEETKKAYNPYDARRRAQEALIGAATQGAFGERPKAKPSRVANIRAAQPPIKPEVVPTNVVPEQLNLFDQFDERSPISKYQTEMAPDMWRVDENGIPIRADLSMEVQNLQQPLQRNLFGDELDVNFPRDPNKPLDMATGDIPGVERFSDPIQYRNDPEGQIPLTEAIDQMAEGVRARNPDGSFAQGTTRQNALDLLRREMEASPALEVAKMEAEGPKLPLGSKARKEAFIASQKGQRGVIDPDVFLKDFPEFAYSKLKDAAGKLKTLYRGVQSDYEGPERPMLGTVGEGIYLTESKTLANNYATGKESGRHVKAAYVDMKQPFEIEMGSPEHRSLLLGDKTSRKQFSDMVKGAGFDGVIIKNGDELKEVMAFKPEQVQNAFSTPSSRVPKKERGGVLFEFGKKKQTTTVDDIAAIERQLDEVGRRYVAGDISHEEMMATNRELIYKKQDMERLELRRKEAVGAGEVTEIFPGYNIIPPGTKVMAKNGLSYPEPTRGEVVGTHQFRYGEKAYNLPVVDFGDGRPRKILPGDITEVFGGPKSPFNFKKQGGAVKIDWSDADTLENKLLSSQDGSYIPPNPKVQEALSAALSEGKDGKLWTYMQSGSTSAAMKTGSAAIKFAAEVVQNAVKRADLAIRQNIFPTEAAFRKLSKQEITELSTLFKDEMFSGQKYDGDVLAQHLTVNQLQAYTKMRKLFETTLEAQNAARKAQGKKPITANEAYMASRWQGDFRMPIVDAEGKTVWYLADDTQRGLVKQRDTLLKQFPDLKAGKEHVVSSLTNKTDLESMYTKMLDILGRDDPAVEKIKAAVEQQKVAEGRQTLGQEKHFKHKSGVRGFVGDRPGFGGHKEALAMFQQQITYAKNAFKWSEMQTAADDIKSLLSDETLQSQQKNNVAYIREYFKNAIGMGESKATRALADSFRNGLGVSPDLLDRGVGNVKSFFITQKLAASAGYTLANLVQTSNVFPYLMNLREQGFKGNPASAMILGVPTGMMMGISHYIGGLGGEYVDRLPNQFLKDAIRYAEDNGVTARSVYDESPIEASFGVSAGAMKTASMTMSVPETFVRSVSFMTYAHMLKDSGKFTDMSKLFQKAEELTNMSMVDYRTSERPMVFAKLGSAGNFLNTLQTYPMSFYNQYAYMVGEASKGRPVGLAAMLALQYGVAGALGLPGFDDADKLYRYFRDELASTEMWNKMMKSPFFSDPKLWMLENLGKASVYGALSDVSGLGMTSRVAAPGAGAMLQSPLGPVTDIAKQIGKVVKAGTSPSATNAAEAALAVAPVGLQGLLETSGMMEGLTHNTNPDGSQTYMKNSDLGDRNAVYTRSPEEVDVRKWGIRSQQEVATRDVSYATQSANQSLTRRSSELIDRYYNAVRTGDAQKAKELAALYMDLTGKSFSDTQIQNQVMEELYTDVQQNVKNSRTPRQLLNAARMTKLLSE